jgi:hypothetical protein
MLKREAIAALIGADDMRQVVKEGAGTYVHGVYSKAARAIGVGPQAVKTWPDPLPRRIEDRVLAAMYRRNHPDEVNALSQA